MFLQLFITYLWWSVGIYDKQHREGNRPFTRSFLAAFALLAVTFYVPFPLKRIIFLTALGINYLPFLLMVKRLGKNGDEFSLSSNMTERLGLFTIIIFGEAILGVINGVSHIADLHMNVWVCFGLGILVVFALWWIFFSTIADHDCKKGVWAANVVSFLYIPMLASLGMVGAAFPALLRNVTAKENYFSNPLQLVFGASITIFLCCITAISRFLVHPSEFEKSKRYVQSLLIIIGTVNLLLMFLFPMLSVSLYLLCVFASLMIIIVVMTRSWFHIELDKLNQKTE